VTLTGKITTETFKYLEMKYGISFPEEIVSAYLQNPDVENDFANMIRRVYQAGEEPRIMLQISSRFAIGLIEAFDALTDVERTELENEIEALDKLNYNEYPSGIEYLLVEGIGFYDLKRDTFTLSIVQRVYEQFNRDHHLLKIGFLCWIHCGGWGHVIIRGMNSGFDGGGMHGHYLEVEYKGKKYAYSSNYYEQSERPHEVKLR
jgi:hypothetical protein